MDNIKKHKKNIAVPPKKKKTHTARQGEYPEPTYFAQGFAPLCSNYTRFVD